MTLKNVAQKTNPWVGAYHTFQCSIFLHFKKFLSILPPGSLIQCRVTNYRLLQLRELTKLSRSYQKANSKIQIASCLYTVPLEIYIDQLHIVENHMTLLSYIFLTALRQIYYSYN